MFRKKKQFKLPLGVTVLLSVAMAVGAYNLPTDNAFASRIAYASAVLVMPEGAVYEFERIKDNITSFFCSQEDDKEYVQQNTERENVSEPLVDLSVTPTDIIQSMNEVLKRFDDDIYIYDGEIVEKTFTDYQATDSFENVYVRNVTETKEINIEDILSQDFFLPIEDISKPVVLIYHTHSTETYIMTDNGKFSSDYPSRNENTDVNMVRIGEEIARVLESNGIGVIHDKTIYDTVYTGAYSKSREGIEQILKENPSIVITLDIHRDAIYYDSYTRVKQITQIENEKAAQMMIIAGAQDGSITDFSSWETNLAFAFHLQKAANEKYENLMKPIYFCCRKYNMDITPYSLLIEVGTDMNTLKEAAYSGRLLGDVLTDLINEFAEKGEI